MLIAWTTGSKTAAKLTIIVRRRAYAHIMASFFNLFELLVGRNCSADSFALRVNSPSESTFFVHYNICFHSTE